MNLFNLNWKTLVLVLLLIAAFAAALFWPKAHAEVLDAPYVQMSGGYTIIRGQTPVLDLTFTEPAPQLRNAYWQESLTVIGESNFQGMAVPNNFVVRALFVDGFGRFDIGLGLSWMQNPAPYNGSPVNFNLQLAGRLPWDLTLTYTHLSNAGSRTPNLGRDIVLVGRRFH
jgi:hypothetical protein